MITQNEILENQKKFFESGKSRNINFIKRKLQQLKNSILKNEEVIYSALHKDLKKSKFEAYISEIGILISEIDLVIKNIHKWSKPKKIRSSMLNFPSNDFIISEPYGCTLVIAPWNYPFQLAISPIISAIASGNTIVLKPSEITKHTGEIIKTLLSDIFEENHLKVVLGGVPETTQLLNLRWDYIFFTGSVEVGKIIAKAASKHLTPCTLELGGKNPCIVDSTANLKLSAKRLVWGKFLNAGQTCIAPDFILAHESIKSKLIDLLITEIKKAYGINAEISKSYPRIVNSNNFERLKAILKGEIILYGGETNSDDNYFAPTLIDSPSVNSKLMQKEIFGPILPILSFKDINDIDKIIKPLEKPLALYVFSTNKNFYNSLIAQYSFGGGAINDTMIQFGNSRLPFGGVGESGIGAYHGKYSYETFTHKKSISIKSNWLDIPIRYAPYDGKLNLLKKVFRWLK
jgi:aldehyde dehydrogenase (NAD+)